MAFIADEVERAHADIIILQEVDRNSKRSHYINEYELVAGGVPDAQNLYKVSFIEPERKPAISKLT